MRAPAPPFVLALVLMSALALPAGAEHCHEPTTSRPEVDTGGSPRFYVDNDVSQHDWPIVPWLYEETNGIDGLQRRDENVDDTCHGMIAPDKLHF